jgi:pilus assembly protein CpaF
MSVVATPEASLTVPMGAPTDDGLLKQRVHQRLVTQPLFTKGVDDVSTDVDTVRRTLGDLLRDEQPLLAAPRFDALLEQLTHEVTGLGPLEPLLADPSVTEVMVNGPGRAYVERAGRLEPVALDLDAAAIVHLVERVVAPLGLRLDRSSPMVDARLADGSRLHAVIPPLAIDGPCVTIRRFGARAVSLAEFGVDGTAARFLRWTVAAGWNLLVAGATSAGKTTLLNALSQSILHTDRIVTIEETAELRLAQPHVVRLEARPPNSEGAGGVAVRALVRAALRMRPDRLIVGEVRAGEALDMLQALNTGHDGSMSTIHANGPVDALARLETLVLLADSGLPLEAVRAQVAASIDAVVFVARGPGGQRRVEAIAEVDRRHPDGARPLFVRRDRHLVPVARVTRRARRHDAARALDTEPAAERCDPQC